VATHRGILSSRLIHPQPLAKRIVHTDLHKIGGFTVVIDCLRRPQASLRHRAANPIAACVQNHPPVQQIALDLGTMPLLVGLLDDDDPMVRKKAIYALSGASET